MVDNLNRHYNSNHYDLTLYTHTNDHPNTPFPSTKVSSIITIFETYNHY